MNILNTVEQEAFESAPVFNSFQRKQYFDFHQAILGGRPGQRLMSRLGMPLSADTLIRRVKGAARWSALPQVIRVLGVDDWRGVRAKPSAPSWLIWSVAKL